MPRYAAGPVALAGVLVLAACTGTHDRSASAPPTACAAEYAAFDAASRDVSTLAVPTEAAAYAAAKTDPGAQAAAVAANLDAKAAGLPDAVGRLTGAYRALGVCRGTAVATTGPTSPERGAERLAFDAELAVARQALDLLRTCDATLPAAVDRLMASLPPSRVRAVRAAAQPPVPQPFVALETAAIHAGPDAASARIADLRKGMRAQGAGGPAIAGWTVLSLNDGSIGYVESAALRPVTLNPSAQAAVRANVAQAASGDPLVALSVVARRTLPQRVQTLSGLVDSAAGTEERLFAPPVAPPGGTARG